MQEYGPFVYRESDSYSEPVAWNVPTTVPGQESVKKNAIRMYFNQTAAYDEKNTKDGNIDTPMW